MTKTKDFLRWAKRLVFLGLSISPIAHANTATTVIDTKAAASGQCSDFGTPQTNLHSCDEGRDQQNHPRDYYLYVDHVSTNLYESGDNAPLGNNEVPVSGNCHLVGNAEMSHIQRITCSATYGKARQQSIIGFNFTSDGKKIDVSYPFRIPPQDRRGARGIQQLDPNRPIWKVGNVTLDVADPRYA